MHSTVVGVLRGGPSSEHEVSLKSGHHMIASLPVEKNAVRDIYIDKQGIWHERGLPILPGDILPKIDVAVIALHGAYGQDGEVQKVLELFNIPYTGANPYHSFNASHKVLAKERAKLMGVKTPLYRLVEELADAESVAYDVVRNFHQPVIIKPISSGSSVGVSLVSGFKPIQDAIAELFLAGAPGVLIEERITGTEATVGVVEGLRGEELYALPPVEIMPATGHELFTYDAKYSGESSEIVPGRFEKQIMDDLMNTARLMHNSLGQRHYSRSDFIVSPKGIYFLELNTAAAVGMTKESLFPKALQAVGVSMNEFLSHIVELARVPRKR